MLNLKSSHKKCLDENAVKLHYGMPDFFINKINKTLIANLIKLCFVNKINITGAPFVITAKTLSQ